LEALQFRFDGGEPPAPEAGAAIVGVVASGNLEVLIEPAPGSSCAIEVNTAAHGFGPTWEAVMRDFFERHRVGGIRVSINDAGATPAIVSLRLDQAIEEFQRPLDER
jgi:malonate decarboxylase delta subunit